MCEYCVAFKYSLFYRTPLVAASDFYCPSAQKDVNENICEDCEKDFQNLSAVNNGKRRAMDARYFLQLTTTQNQRTKIKQRMMTKFFKAQKLRK